MSARQTTVVHDSNRAGSAKSFRPVEHLRSAKPNSRVNEQMTDNGGTNDRPKTLIALLAAGASRRFGDIKLVQKLGSETDKAPENSLIGHSYLKLAAVASDMDAELVVVTGAHRDAVMACLPDRAVTVHNEDWHDGIGSSIATATRVAKAQGAARLMITLGDQVALSYSQYLKLLNASVRADTRICAYYDLNLGVPAIFCREDFDPLSQLSGDRGAKALLTQRYQEGSLIAFTLPAAAVDIDTPAQLCAYRTKNQPFVADKSNEYPYKQR